MSEIQSDTAQKPERSGEAFRRSTERVRLAMAELALARKEQADLLNVAGKEGGLYAAAYSIDAINSKRWGEDPNFTQRMVANIESLLTPGEPFVIADREAPHRFIIGNTPADPLLDSYVSKDHGGKVIQADVLFKEGDEKTQIAHTRPWRTNQKRAGGFVQQLHYEIEEPPHYFERAAAFREFFGDAKLKILSDTPDGIVARTKDSILVTNMEQVSAQFTRALLLLADHDKTPDDILLAIRHNMNVLNRIQANSPVPAACVENLSESQREQIIEGLYVRHLEAEKQARKEQDREDYYDRRRRSWADEVGTWSLVGFSGRDPLLALFPEHDIPGRILQQLGHYRVSAKSYRQPAVPVDQDTIPLA